MDINKLHMNLKLHNKYSGVAIETLEKKNNMGYCSLSVVSPQNSREFSPEIPTPSLMVSGGWAVGS